LGIICLIADFLLKTSNVTSSMSNTTSNNGFTATRLVIVDLQAAFHTELVRNGITKWYQKLVTSNNMLCMFQL